jgi:hypothetical protein
MAAARLDAEEEGRPDESGGTGRRRPSGQSGAQPRIQSIRNVLESTPVVGGGHLAVHDRARARDTRPSRARLSTTAGLKVERRESPTSATAAPGRRDSASGSTVSPGGGSDRPTMSTVTGTASPAESSHAEESIVCRWSSRFHLKSRMTPYRYSSQSRASSIRRNRRPGDSRVSDRSVRHAKRALHSAAAASWQVDDRETLHHCSSAIHILIGRALGRRANERHSASRRGITTGEYVTPFCGGVRGHLE